MKLFLLIIFLFIAFVVFSQFNPVPIANWKSYPVPKDKDTLYNYNSDPNDWYVFQDSNTIYVKKLRDHYDTQKKPFHISPEIGEERIFQARRYAIINVDDGFLIAYHRGEYGGLLYWVSKDNESKYKVGTSLIDQFIIRNRKIYAIEDGHLKGRIVEIKKKKKKWLLKKYLNLPSEPDAIQLDSKNNFILATSTSLLSIGLNREIDTLIANGIWESYLYPSSMAIQNDVVFIGMRKGVFKYDLVTKEETWLLPY